jgi:dCTP deaminase
MSAQSFWSGEKLLENCGIVEPFREDQIDCNAYELRMGSLYYRTADTETGKPQVKTALKELECFTIPPGQFAYLISKEVVKIPLDAMAFISMKTGIKLQGLINVSGFHVDPGYIGPLIYGVYNASPSPIHVCENDKLFKIWLCDLDRTSGPKYTFSGQSYGDISNELIRGMSKEIYSLQSLADKMRTVENSLTVRMAEQKSVVDHLQNVYRVMTLGVFGALAVAVIAAGWPLIKYSAGYVHDYWLPRVSTEEPWLAPDVRPQ